MAYDGRQTEAVCAAAAEAKKPRTCRGFSWMLELELGAIIQILT
jgi:hypothetical protein